MDQLLFQDTIAGGATWSHILKRGTALRLTPEAAGANVGALFYNADNLYERLNLPDTLKAQHTARLTAGHVLYSDMARILVSVTTDTAGWHDALGGCSDARLVAEKYGPLSYAEARNGWHQNALDGFLVELAKYGLGVRDLSMNVNFFSKVAVADNGSMSFVPGSAPAGAQVELRAEMNTLVLLNTAQHPMDPNPRYAPVPVAVEVRRVPPPAPDDPCRISCEQNRRGFTLTERYFL